MVSGKAVTLVIQVLTDTTKAQKGISVMGQQVSGKMLAIGAGVAGVAIAATAAIVDMTKAAAADAAEQDRLVQAYQNAGAATGDYAASIDTAIARGQELAFTDTEIRDALVPLIAVSGDAAKANEDLALAQDIARAKNVDLETAAKAVAKAQAGQGTQLARLMGINAKGMTSTELLTQAQATAAGQAEAYGKTTAGQAAAMEIGFSELTEMIGSAFLPVLAEIIPVLGPILKQFGALIKALLPVLIPLIKLLVIPLKILVTVLGFVADLLVRLVTWFGRIISKVGEFLSKLGPVRDAAGFIGDILPGGNMAAAAMGPMGPTMRGGAPGATGSVPGGAPLFRVSGSVTVTHKVSDPGRALADLPGGAAAVAAALNRGADASGLYRNLQHAAGLR